LTLFIVFLFLAIYNAGCMTTLQLQHYGIYPAVGREGFADYMKANNRAAAVPTIVPGILLLLVSVGLVFFRPPFVGTLEGVTEARVGVYAFGDLVQAELGTCAIDDIAILVRAQFQEETRHRWIRTPTVEDIHIRWRAVVHHLPGFRQRGVAVVDGSNITKPIAPVGRQCDDRPPKPVIARDHD